MSQPAPPEFYREQARRVRDLAETMSTPSIRAEMDDLAVQYETLAGYADWVAKLPFAREKRPSIVNLCQIGPLADEAGSLNRLLVEAPNASAVTSGGD
jgi:hypothetical protein